MTLLVIPTSPDDPFYTQISELDGVEYTLDFRYNQLENRWYLTIGDVAGVDLLKGIKLVPGADLLFYHKTIGLPPGQLLVLASGDGSAPGLGELGPQRRCSLIYNSVTVVL